MRKRNYLDGIDVSEWNGEIRFREVREAGIQLVYMKATQGTDYVDREFERNYTEAVRERLKVGFYHYVSARTVQEAQEEAQFFAEHIRRKHKDARPAMDFEVFEDLSEEAIRDIGSAFLITLERELKIRPALYSDASNASRIFADSRFTRYPLWIAEYGVARPDMENPWSRWSGWQYSDAGRVSGIASRVDLDYFRRELLLDREETKANEQVCSV